jgi:hypothetical protein
MRSLQIKAGWHFPLRKKSLELERVNRLLVVNLRRSNRNQ